MYQALGVQLKTDGLPCLLHCLFCRAPKMYLFSDPYDDGAWTYCAGCRFSGDMIELASRSWKLDIRPTILKLAQLGILELPDATAPHATDDYETRFVAVRRNLNAYNEECHRRLLEDYARLSHGVLARYGWMTYHSHEVITLRMARYLGMSDRIRAEAVLRPMATRQHRQPDRRTLSTGQNKLFLGPKWSEILTVPYYDLPGRLRGFALVGRQGSDEDQTFATLWTTDHPNTNSPMENDRGIAMLETMFYPSWPTLGDAVFVFRQLDTALRMQAAWLQNNERPLPIMAVDYSSHRAATHIWSRLPKRNFIFVDDNFHPGMFQAARSANGRVVLDRFPPCECAASSVMMFLTAMLRKSKYWVDGLQLRMERSSNEVVENLLLQLELNPDEQRQFAGRCSPELRDRLQRITAVVPATRQVKIQQRVIQESDTGWYVARTGARICNAIIRVEQIIVTESKTYYRGNVLFKQQPHAFCEDAVVFDNNPLVWCEQFLRTAGAGQLLYDADWSRHIKTLAFDFHEPEVITGITRAGWQEKTQSFQFPQFELAIGGNITIKDYAIVSGKDIPAKTVTPPRTLLTTEIQSLSQPGDDTRIFWAMLHYLLYGLLASRYRQPKLGLCLVGFGAQQAGERAAQAVDSPTLTFMNRFDVLDAGVLRLSEAHDWPVRIRGPLIRGESAAVWIRDGRHVILPVDPAWAAVAGAYGRWHTLSVPSPTTLQSLDELVPATIASYLEDLCGRQLELPQPAASLARRLWSDLSEWFGRRGGDNQLIHDAESLVSSAGSQPPRWHLLQLMFYLLEQGELGYHRQGYAEGRQPAVVCDPEEDSLWLPTFGLNRWLQAKKIPTLDLVAMARDLASAQILLREEARHDQPGLVVPESWWNQHYQEWKERIGKSQLRLLTGS